MDMWHTETPPALQGRGLAKVVTMGAIKYANEHGFKVKPSCTYVAKVVRENPDAVAVWVPTS